MDTPTIYRHRPSLFPMALLGGLVATILHTALLYLAPALGLPAIDLPRLMGGLFTADAGTALGVGAAVFLLNGILVLPLPFAIYWKSLPGDDIEFRGALLKGLVTGLALWLASGVLLPVLGALNQVRGFDATSPGPLALGEGAIGAAWFLLAQVVYGLSFALVGAMTRGIAPVDTIGWMWTSHGSGESP